jgi:hypothetical protein
VTDLPDPYFIALAILHHCFAENDIRYQLTGGMAARLYGSSRALNDIDIEVNERDIERVQIALAEYVTKGLYRLIDDSFDIWMMTLNIDGTPVDISQAAPILLRGVVGSWQRFDAHIENSKIINVRGIPISVVELDGLLSYKTVLGRSVDLEDTKKLGSYGASRG